jgi:REP-associated tyrosine transposase
MARRRRDTAAGIFHVFTHYVWAADSLYRDDEDRSTFLRELARATARVRWRCAAYCLMGTHYHLILDVDADALARGMHSLNFRYAISFNKRHGMKGHVLGTRYNAFRISGEASLLSRFKYVARNPVEAGLCELPADWPWSSYGGTIGVRRASSFVDDTAVLSCLDPPRELARGRLHRYVSDP